MTDLIALADGIEYAIDTTGSATIYPSGAKAIVAALRASSPAEGAEPVNWPMEVERLNRHNNQLRSDLETAKRHVEVVSRDATDEIEKHRKQLVKCEALADSLLAQKGDYAALALNAAGKELKTLLTDDLHRDETPDTSGQ